MHRLHKASVPSASIGLWGAELFAWRPEAVRNTAEVAGRCALNPPGPGLPLFRLPGGPGTAPWGKKLSGLDELNGD